MPFQLAFTIISMFLCVESYSQMDQWQMTPLPKLNESIIAIDIDSAQQVLRVTTRNNEQSLYNGYSFEQLQTTSTVIDENPVDSLTIGPISDKISHNGQSFFATLNNGIWIREGQRIQKFIIQDQVIPQNILALESNAGHMFMLTTDSQLFIWEKDSYELRAYDIPKTEYISDVTVDNWGQLWLLGESNLFYDFYNKNDNPPQLKIIDIQSSFESIEQPWTNLEFDAEEVILSFKPTVTYLPGQALQYQFKIKGDQWSPFSSHPEVNLTGLAPGNYEFQFRAKSDDSILGYSELIPFTVRQSFWNSSWPWLLGGIGGLLLLWGFSFNSQRQALQRIQSSANKYRLENQLLKSKQETKQLQMNPHFLFNSLNTIQGIVAMGDAKKARHLLNQYAQLMRSLLDQSREDAITIEHEVQFLTRYLQLEQAARNDKFDFHIETDPSLDKNITIPPMILQPLVENAIVHGMKGIQHKGKINVEISAVNEPTDTIQVVIDDNGVGRDTSASSHQSHGLSILTERLQSYSTFKRLPSIEITDKMEDNKPTGTRVHITLTKLSK